MKAKTINQQPLCENQLSSGSLLQQLWRASSSFMHAQKMNLSQRALAMSQVLRASLAAEVEEIGGNNRLLAALVLMLAIAPLSSIVYRLFDKTVVVEGWFFVNYFNLLLGLKGNLLAFFTLLGAFFLFPARYKASYILSAPLGFIVADTVKKILATTNEEYNSIASFPYAVLGIGLMLGALLSMDHFLYKHHHIKRKYWAHIVQIIRTPGIPAEQKMKLLDGEISSVENKYYAIY